MSPASLFGYSGQFLVLCGVLWGSESFEPPLDDSVGAEPRPATAPLGDPFSEFFLPPEAWGCEYWETKPLPARLIDLPVNPVATPQDRQKVEDMKQGIFQPVYTYDPLPLGVPPPWDVNPYGSSTWDLWRHSLVWTEPLVKVWLTDGDADSFDLMREIVEDWWAHNSTPPGASPQAWSEGAVAWRCQRLLWFWEMYRTHCPAGLDTDLAMLLVEAIQTHANWCATHYYPHSNHGLMLTTSLLEVVGVMPEFIEAPAWRDEVSARMGPFLDENFSDLGFHLEQTPSYHIYMVDRLACMAAFETAVDMPPTPNLDQTARAAASLAPWLSRPNALLIGIGDCSNTGIWTCLSKYAGWWPADTPVAAPSSLPNPRDDESSFLVDFESGYAIFGAGPPYRLGGTGCPEDAYATFRCNSTNFCSHVHSDGLSFTVYGLGRNWLIDPGGPYNYAAGYPRLFFTGYRAHNVLLVDEAASHFAPVELLGLERQLEGDYVECRHEMAAATQVRRFTFRPPREFEVRDVVWATDAAPHTYSQLFHVHEDVVIRIVSNEYLEVVAPNGRRCAIQQQASTPGQWSVMSAQTQPYWQGWYTYGYGQLDPAPAIYFSSATPQLEWEVTSTIRLLPPAVAGDFLSFTVCMVGPDQPHPPGGGVHDVDGDNDVDLADYGQIQLTQRLAAP